MGSETIQLGVIGLLVVATVFLIVFLVGTNNKNKQLEIEKSNHERKLNEARQEADSMVKDALREAKELAINETKEAEKIQKEKINELQKIEKRVQKRDESLNLKEKNIETKEKDLKKQQELLLKEEKRASEALLKAEQKLHESFEKLESIAKLSLDEARTLLKQSIETEVRRSTAAEVRQIEDEAKKTAEDKAKGIIATSIQRLANEFVSDVCVSVVNLPTDDMKGRIIGREGRNIRAIEQATGVDLIIDDTPEAVIISCFNPIRREIAKVAIERLVADGRIHPARIDEVVQKVTSEFDVLIQETGERAAFDCGIDSLPHELLILLGKLKFRSSAGQSVLQHSIETSQIAGFIAAELELNVRHAKRAGLLHDIGKALDEDNEGHHSTLGAQLLQKTGENADVIEAIQKHHQEHLSNVSPLTVILQAANQLSSFRPGARKEFVEKSISRLRDMESSISQFAGVDQAFVIRSGKEVRAMVSPTIQQDDAVSQLARSVARKIRQDINFPGQVKVTMVREQRVTHFAK
jgi:ribonucrease Y